jgi:hypothetical protein
MAEITWKAPDDDGPTSSQTFQLRVANDVHRGDESSPVYIPNYGQGTPVAPVVATATTSMAGANNDWDLAATVAGAAANAYSLSVAVETGKADGPDVSIVGTDVVVTAGDKAIMVVTGTLTDGTDPVVFPPLEYFETDPRPRYEGESVSIAYDDNDNKWRMVYFNDYTSITSYWESSNNVATPDLVTTWTPVSPATGTPTVTALAHTAAQCKAAFDATTANETLFTLTNKSGNDGTGSVTTAGPITLSGGIEGTASTPGLMLYDENFLYIATNGNGATDPATWRKIAHSAL